MARAAKTPVDNATLLRETALSLTAAGYFIHAMGANKKPSHEAGFLDTPEAIATTSATALGHAVAGTTTGISIITGVKALYGTEDDPRLLFAFEHEGTAMADRGYLTEWKTAVEQRGMEDTLNRLSNGWSERTPSGGERYFFFVEAPDAAYAAQLKKVSGVLSATRGGETFSELLVTKAAIIIAPSYGKVHPTGKPYELIVGGPETAATLSFGEVNALSEALADVSDTLRESTSTTRLLDSRSRQLMHQLNTKLGEAGIDELVLKHGWAHAGITKDGSREYRLAGGHGTLLVGGKRHEGALWTFSTSVAQFANEVHYRPGDIKCLLEFDGDYEGMLRGMEADGYLKYTPWPLSVRRPTEVYVDEMNRLNLARKIGEAVRDAQHPTAKDVPFALALTTPDGRGMIAPVSLTNEQGLRRWAPRQHEELLLSIVQPVKSTMAGKRYQHGLPASIVSAVLPEREVPAALVSVSYAGTEPVLLPDGQTVSTPGYHPKKKALVAIAQTERPFWKAYSVPEKPTPGDVDRAAKLIFGELLVDFPFETEGDRARALSYLLTAASRGLYNACPGWVLDAADRGTGKTLLSEIMRIVSTGETGYTAIGYSRATDTETEKAVVAASLAGSRNLHVDELPREDRVDSKVLMELITGDGSGTRRVLGGSQQIAIAPMMITICGSNAEVGGDSNRRYISVRMVHKAASLAFERTTFRHENIKAWAKENRPELLAALHTILAYGLQHPVPAKALPAGYGSFEDWLRVVGSALSYVTMGEATAAEHFNEGRAEFLEDGDDEGQEWGPIMEAWVAKFDDGFVTAKKAYETLGKSTGKTAIDLPFALKPTAGESEAGHTKSWGRALTKRKSSITTVDGMLYRYEVRRDAKRGNSFRITTQVSETYVPKNVVDLHPETSIPQADATAPTLVIVPEIAVPTAPVAPVVQLHASANGDLDIDIA